MADRPDPAALAGTVKQLSDEQLEESVRQMGVDEVLDAIFAGMADAFRPEKAQGVESTIQYDIAVDGEVKQYRVDMRDGRCETGRGPADQPRLTLQLGLVDFVRLIFNQVEGPQLFMSGKLKLKGDMMFAMQMQGFFDRNF